MPLFRLYNTVTGAFLGQYEVADEAAARDSMARAYGYADFSTLEKQEKVGEFEIAIARYADA